MIRFDPAVLGHDRARRETLLQIAARGLEAVAPGEAIRRVVARRGTELRVGDQSVDLSDFEHSVVIGFGKAAVGMGEAVVPLLAGRPVTGVLVTNAVAPVESLEVLEGSHPVPDERSVSAGRRVLEHANSAGSGDLVVVLISGGGSALLALPGGNLSLGDLQETNSVLLRSGAAISEVNTVRKHLSAVKGGRLAAALSGAGAVVTLVISDVVGNPLDAIASGPTVPDPTTFDDALAVLDRYDAVGAVPASVLAHLRAGVADVMPQASSDGGVFARQIIEVVADAGLAAEAAVAAAGAVGHRARVVTTTLEGEARFVARQIVDEATTLGKGEMLVYAGETTVTVTGEGTGGRNQELALAASIELAGRDEVIVLALGTDGIDGMTPVAGAFGDGSAVERGNRMGLDASDHLTRNDSYPFLEAIGDAVRCGPTGTNVGDLILVWRADEVSG